MFVSRLERVLVAVGKASATTVSISIDMPSLCRLYTGPYIVLTTENEEWNGMEPPKLFPFPSFNLCLCWWIVGPFWARVASWFGLLPFALWSPQKKEYKKLRITSF